MWGCVVVVVLVVGCRGVLVWMVLFWVWLGLELFLWSLVVVVG